MGERFFLPNDIMDFDLSVVPPFGHYENVRIRQAHFVGACFIHVFGHKHII